mgnify:CR=1 FL=1
MRARRTYSNFDMSSQKINVEIGQRIVDATGAKVDLKNADATITIELFGSACIVSRRRLQGPGGLPVGVSGKMLALMSGGIDSPVAAWRMGRRGAEIEMVHFHGRPFTDPSSIRQASELAETLTKYQLQTVLHLLPLLSTGISTEAWCAALLQSRRQSGVRQPVAGVSGRALTSTSTV